MLCLVNSCWFGLALQEAWTNPDPVGDIGSAWWANVPGMFIEAALPATWQRSRCFRAIWILIGLGLGDDMSGRVSQAQALQQLAQLPELQEKQRHKQRTCVTSLFVQFLSG